MQFTNRNEIINVYVSGNNDNSEDEHVQRISKWYKVHFVNCSRPLLIKDRQVK